jgi:hypothetical protein
MAKALKLRADRFRTEELVADFKDRAGCVADITFDALIGCKARLHQVIVKRGEPHGVNIPHGSIDS